MLVKEVPGSSTTELNLTKIEHMIYKQMLKNECLYKRQ